MHKINIAWKKDLIILDFVLALFFNSWKKIMFLTKKNFSKLNKNKNYFLYFFNNPFNTKLCSLFFHIAWSLQKYKNNYILQYLGREWLRFLREYRPLFLICTIMALSKYGGHVTWFMLNRDNPLFPKIPSKIRVHYKLK